MTEQAPTLKGSLRRAATAILSPPRTALAVALGVPVLLVRGFGLCVRHHVPFRFLPG